MQWLLQICIGFFYSGEPVVAQGGFVYVYMYFLFKSIWNVTCICSVLNVICNLLPLFCVNVE